MERLGVGVAVLLRVPCASLMFTSNSRTPPGTDAYVCAADSGTSTTGGAPRCTVTPEREAFGMCLKCDGYSDEEIARGVELIIATNGWMVQGVEAYDGPNAHDGFAYTIGATASYGLPELVIMDMDYRDAHGIINWAVEYLRDGGSLNDFAIYKIEWAPVHDDLLDSGLFGTYTRHYGEPPSPGGVVQLFPPDFARCAPCSRLGRTDLSDPNTTHPYSDDEF